jgi:hypothetical protein
VVLTASGDTAKHAKKRQLRDTGLSGDHRPVARFINVRLADVETYRLHRGHQQPLLFPNVTE